MHKGILPLLLLLIFCFYPPAVSANWIPEENPIGETLIVEDDHNIIRDNLDKETENKENQYDPEIPETIDMTKETYFDRCVKPFLLLFGTGIALFFCLELFKGIRNQVKR